MNLMDLNKINFIYLNYESVLKSTKIYNVRKKNFTHFG